MTDRASKTKTKTEPTATTAPKSNAAAEKRGGLPDATTALSAFTLPEAAAAAFAPPARKPRDSPQPTPAAPAPAMPAPAAPAQTGETPGSAPAVTFTDKERLPVRPPAEHAPAAGPGEPTVSVREVEGGQTSTQAMAMVTDDVRQRFEDYQSAQRQQHGNEPTNAVVVRRAFTSARRDGCFGQLLQKERRRQQPVVLDEDGDDDNLFGDVANRRPARGRTKGRVQLSFRPSRRELAVYDAWAEAYRFDNRSDFLNAVLDHFLPDSSQRRGR
ncbi:hypothetical protein [Streptomyces sp. NPDC088348]|uniref:hypothetical protein n=1 Tax=Streptomyces sp. NPDC088348 TaxID=3365853 RepID=UPI0038011E20